MRTHVTSCFTMPRSTTSTTPDSTLGTCGHIPDSVGGVGAFQMVMQCCLRLVSLQRLLQSVLIAAARLIYRLGYSDHIADVVVYLRWLRVPQRTEFKPAVLTYKYLFNEAPHYLGLLVRVADLPGRRALSFANTDRLLVPSVILSVGPSWRQSLSGRCTSYLKRFAKHCYICLVIILLPAAFQDLPLWCSFLDIIVTPEWTSTVYLFRSLQKFKTDWLVDWF